MSASKLHHLIELAGEPSSARRRELLRELTDLFFVAPQSRSGSEAALFDGVMTQLASDMEAAVRAELAVRLSEADIAPQGLIRSLAHEDLSIAGPILSRPNALSTEDQVSVANTRGQGHLKALSQRPGLAAAVSDVIVERGDDEVLNALLRNDTAELSREAAETVVTRAADNSALHEAVVSRASLPTDLLNEMYFVVEAKLRSQILERNASMDPAQLEAALEAGRLRVAADDGALPADFAAAQAAVGDLMRRKALTPPVLASMLRDGATTRFLVALSELAKIDFLTARKIIEARELDTLAVVCKAADFDRALFLTFALLVLGRDGDAMGRAREYGEIYSQLSTEAACRTIRFWRMRRNTGGGIAA